MCSYFKLISIISYIALILMPAPAISEEIQLEDTLYRLQRNLAKKSAVNAKNCEVAISSWTNKLASLTSNQVIPQTERQINHTINASNQILRSFFLVRLALKQNLDNIKIPTPACVTLMRRAIRYSRFAEDYFSEWLINKAGTSNSDLDLFSDKSHSYILNPKFKNLEFKSGDILIMRGPHFISSLIARFGDEEGDFSHLAIIGADDYGEKYVIESLLQSGIVITPLNDYLHNKEEARVALLRYKSSKIAEYAGKEIYRYTKHILDNRGQISYNFSFNLSEKNKLYCAQVAHFAYSNSSNGRIYIPKFMTSIIAFKKTTLVRALKIAENKIFTPSDIQFDPNFDIVSEYKNSNLLTDARRANVAMSYLIDLIKAGYSPNPDGSDLVMGNLINSFIIDGSDAIITPDDIAILLAYENSYQNILQTASQIDGLYIKSKGYPMTFNELKSNLVSSPH